MYIVDASADEPIILINDHIGIDAETGQGISGGQWAAELMYLDSLGKKTIKVWINSMGGHVVDGWDMYNAMMQTKAKVDTYCTGIAASMAAVLFQAGRKRIMMDYGVLMYHNPFGENAGDDMVNAFKNSLVTMVASRSNMDTKAVSDMMSKETFLNANEARLMSLCDEIMTGDEFNKKRLQPIANISEAKTLYRANVTVLNSLLNNNKFDMKQITNRLKLVDGASEQSVLDAIAAIENSATAALANVTARDLRITELQNSLTALTTERDTIKNELGTLKTAQEAATKAAKQAAAKTAISNAIKKGQIKLKNSAAPTAEDLAVTKQWEEAYEGNPTGVQSLIDSIPTTQKAPEIVNLAKFETESNLRVSQGVAADMADIRNRLMPGGVKYA